MFGALCLARHQVDEHVGTALVSGSAVAVAVALGDRGCIDQLLDVEGGLSWQERQQLSHTVSRRGEDNSSVVSRLLTSALGDVWRSIDDVTL